MMRGFSLTLWVVFLCVTLAGPIQAKSTFPQVKIDGVEWMDGSRVQIRVTFLDGQKRPVALDRLSEVVVLEREGKSRPEAKVSFQFGVASELDDTATILPRAKTESSLAVAVIAPATLASPWLNPTLDTHLRKGLESLFKVLGESDRANLIWVGDHLYTFIPTRGKLGQFSNLVDRYDDCVDAKTKAILREPPSEGVQAGGTLEDLHEEACSLVSNHGEIGALLQGSLGHGGYYPNLFGVRVPLPDVKPAQLRQEVLGTRQFKPLPAMGEAFRMILERTQPASQRAIVLVSDGMDGYLEAEADALLRFREVDCPKQVGEGKGAERARKIEQCAKTRLDQFRAAEQGRFAVKASAWLALAHASGTRIHGVGFPSNSVQQPYFADRVQVLAVESGGTYRHARGPNELYEALSDLAGEMEGQYVLEFDSGLKSGEELNLRISVQVDQGKDFQSQDFPLYRTLSKDRLLPEFVGDRLAWVQAKVGFYWYRVLYVVVTILFVLLLLWAFWKGVKGLGKKIAKGVEKKKKGLKKDGKAKMKNLGGGKR